MKRIIYIAIAFLLVTACSDEFLDLSPESYSNSSSFFKTEDHFEMATVGIYQSLQSIADDRSLWLVGEQRSDNTHYDFYAGNRGNGSALTLEHIADFIDLTDNKHTNNFYFNSYVGISRANTVIDRIEDKNFSDEFKQNIVGQAKCIRAYLYFNLVRFFGGVPLYINEVKTSGHAFLPRASVNEVYEQIISDLNDAIDYLPKPSFPQDGRVTQGTARMIMAEALITKPEKDYAAAKDHLIEISKMGYVLLDDYAEVFDPSNKNHIESIFEIQFQEGDQGQESRFVYRMLPKTSDVSAVTGINTNILTVGGWNMPTDGLVDSYEDGDERLNKSVAVAVGSPDANGMILVENVLEVGDEAINDYDMYRYFTKKYLHLHSKAYNTNENWPVYRYSDALLMLAECYLELGEVASGLPHLNKVRKRAGLESLSSYDKELIMNERRHELAFEAHRWFDLLRMDNVIEIMTQHGETMKAKYSNLTERTYQINENKLVYPIPYREISLNPELEQNPSYSN
ncbi:MAG: RagB/SusD family nutrient uptake outer membrane protein [Prolixibacteraceae bacterium]|jgi:hypothetical protein|nr:RagB/SusD family nutrient uptake outer membrane protein [Prolixibacteraceae bacterium]